MKQLKYSLSILIFLLLAGALSSCDNDNELYIRNDYEYSIEFLPIPKKLKQGDIVLLEFSIIREGHYNETSFNFRYFQMEGQGLLSDTTGSVYAMNRLYSVPSEHFTLVYQSACEEAQQLDFVFMDNFGRKVEYTVSFQSYYNREDENTESD